MASNDLLVSLRTQVLAGLEKRTDQNLTHVFNSRKNKVTDMLPISELSAALREISPFDCDEVQVSPAELFSLKESITFETFKRVAEKRSALDQWAQSVPLWQLLSDSIPRKHGVRRCFAHFLSQASADLDVMVSSIIRKILSKLPATYHYHKSIPLPALSWMDSGSF
jgi:hypothetical protein